jgi:hypothetical protein
MLQKIFHASIGPFQLFMCISKLSTKSSVMMDIVFLTRLHFFTLNHLWKVRLLQIRPQSPKRPQKPILSLIKLPNIEAPSIELLNNFSTLTLK